MLSSLISHFCMEHLRFYRRGDRSFRKAEKQRLKAEKRLLKAEVKEIRKQLKMERRGVQWNSSHRDGSSSPVLLQPRATQHNSPEWVKTEEKGGVTLCWLCHAHTGKMDSLKSMGRCQKTSLTEQCKKKGLNYFLARRPKRPCPLAVPAMTAAFLDENLPDGTRLRPGTKFIKYWKMRNTGTVSWSTDTKVKNSTLITKNLFFVIYSLVFFSC